MKDRLFALAMIATASVVAAGDENVDLATIHRIKDEALYDLAAYPVDRRMARYTLSFRRSLGELARVAYIVHLYIAFRIYHHGSHAEAVQHTEDVTGFGPGIYVSHFFTLVWTIEPTSSLKTACSTAMSMQSLTLSTQRIPT